MSKCVFFHSQDQFSFHGYAARIEKRKSQAQVLHRSRLSAVPLSSPPLLSVSSLSLSLSLSLLSPLASRLSPLPSPLSFLFRLVSPFPISSFLIFANPFLSLLLFHNSNDGQALQQFVKILRTETNLAAGTHFYKLELYRTTKLISFALATALYSLCI